MSTTRKPIRLETWIFAAVMVVLFALFAWRQFFGFNKNDEIFYISTVYRFFQGDAMLVDEWNNVQLFALLIYPFYSLIRLFHHSNAEMILIFRIGYLLVHGAAAAYCYIRLKRFGWVRILPALFYFMSTPYNINSLSYNTLAFGFVLWHPQKSGRLEMHSCVVCLPPAQFWRILMQLFCFLFTELFAQLCGCGSESGEKAGRSFKFSIFEAFSSWVSVLSASLYCL